MNYGCILVEGQTEETFVTGPLTAHLQTYGLWLQPIILKTSHPPGGRAHRGGMRPYPQVKKELRRLLGNSSYVLVSTMFDFYKLPKSFPGVGDMPQNADCYAQVEHLEQALKADMDEARFLPYLSLHEFEALLFSDVKRIVQAFPRAGGETLKALRRIRGEFGSPEEINDEQPPAMRLQALLPDYKKELQGPQVADDIGLRAIREACPHFAGWLARLETWGSL